jgi:hypothetical protein
MENKEYTSDDLIGACLKCGVVIAVDGIGGTIISNK